MSATKVEQYCQTGGSLASIPSATYYFEDDRHDDEYHLTDAHPANRFRSVSEDDDDDDDHKHRPHTPFDEQHRQRKRSSTSRNGSVSCDYDEVAATPTGTTDNSSLHLHLEEIERKATPPQPAGGEAAKFRLSDAWPQLGAAMIANLLPMQAGINMAYSAILIPQLSGPLSEIPITKDEASWIASLVTISLPLGSLAIGPLIDRYGRKPVSILATLPFLAGWLLVFGARNVHMLYAARLMCGAAGGLSTISIIYVSEVADARVRPALLCLNSVYVSLGILVTCALGMFFDWRTIAGIYAGMTAVSFVLLLLLPESPRWLRTFRPAEVHRMQRSLRWLYRRDVMYEANLAGLLKEPTQSQKQHQQQQKLLLPTATPIKQQPQPVGPYVAPVTSISTRWSVMFGQPHVYKPLGILLVMFVFQQLSGAYVIIFYAINLFLQIGGQFGEGINEYGALLLLGTIRFVMSIVAALLSQKVGRRKLMFISGLGMAVCTLFAGLYMHYEQLLEEYYARTENPTDDIDPEHKGNDVVVLCCVLGYVSFCALGFMVIPWILIGELLPTEVKGVLGGVVMAAAYVLMFGAVKAFPYTMDWLGAQGIFYVFATTSFAGVVYAFLYLPETMGRSFEEIERRFRRRR